MEPSQQVRRVLVPGIFLDEAKFTIFTLVDFDPLSAANVTGNAVNEQLLSRMCLQCIMIDHRPLTELGNGQGMSLHVIGEIKVDPSRLFAVINQECMGCIK